MNSPQYLEQAIAAARAGRREQAMYMLQQIVEAEPGNAQAWLWLSGVADGLDDQIAALEKALAISPDHLKGQARLKRLYARREKQIKTRQTQLIEEARTAKNAGHSQEAREILIQLVEEYERNETAWLMLSELVDDADDQIVALENALTLNPNNRWAKTRLAAMKRLQHNPLALGDMYLEQGQLDRAQTAFYSAAIHGSTLLEQRQGERRLADLQRMMQLPGFKPVHPTLALARLTFGPPLLYGLMALIQGGLNPLAVPLELYPATMGVLLGSFLLASVSATPHHRLWTSLLGPEGLSGWLARSVAGLAGLCLLVAPFALLLSEAFDRLNIYRTALY